MGKPPPPEDATVHIPLFVDGSAEEITTEVSIRIGPSGDTGTEQKELASEHWFFFFFLSFFFEKKNVFLWEWNNYLSLFSD